jgi:hypothetical protein
MRTQWNYDFMASLKGHNIWVDQRKDGISVEIVAIDGYYEDFLWNFSGFCTSNLINKLCILSWRQLIWKWTSLRVNS